MGPRKKGTSKGSKHSKLPVQTQPQPALSPSTTSSSSVDPMPAIRKLTLPKQLDFMMGDETADSSDQTNESTNNNNNNNSQSNPNFSTLSSHKHSSPRQASRSKKSNAPKRQQSTAGASKVAPVFDAVQSDTLNELSITQNEEEETADTSDNSRATRSRSRTEPSISLAEPFTSQQQSHKRHSRKQMTPSRWQGLREIYKLQGTVHLLIPRLPFGRVIREILGELTPSSMKVTVDMLECLQEAAEIYMVQLFEDAYKCTYHRGRITLMPKDIHLTLAIRGK